MGVRINPKETGFRRIIQDRLYVDKTNLIAFINDTIWDMSRKFICSSWPRRFGKSYALEMLNAYYSKGASSREIFASFDIAKEPGFDIYLNKMDVISLNLIDYDSALPDIGNPVARLQKDIISRLSKAYPGAISSDSTMLTDALWDIHNATGTAFYFLIDEWDVLFRTTKPDEAAQNEYLALLNSLFKGSTSVDVIAGAYMTGILPISKCGTHSALNNFNEYSILRPGPLKLFMGFSELESRFLCHKQVVDYEELRKWYDGYKVGDLDHVYNPSSVIQAVATGRFANYWKTTETYEALKLYIDLNIDGLKDAISDMLCGKAVRVNPDLYQGNWRKMRNKEQVLTLLVHLGYLSFDECDNTVRIPNEEIKSAFRDSMAVSDRTEFANAVALSDRLLEATLAMDGDTVAKLLGEVHMANTTPGYYNNEQALCSAVRLAYMTAVDHYLRLEELQGGRGYVDMLFIPREGGTKPPLLLELKWDKSVSDALSQIERKDYAQALRKLGYSGRILVAGINYSSTTGEHSARIVERHI